jgi:drug/metabolite transporter superfamily protein YnfA
VDLGATAQATVPGFYAWLVTVAPAAFGRGARPLSKAMALTGLALLLLAPLCERRWPSVGRIMSIWGLVITSLVVWLLATVGSTSPTRWDPLKNIAGLIGWSLFALASVAPALPPREVAKEDLSRKLQRRGDSGVVDALIVGAAILLAAVLQCVGWQAEEPERAVLVRLVALGAGVMLIGASALVVAGRHAARRALAPTKRAKRAIVPLVLFVLWVAAGALYEMYSGR